MQLLIFNISRILGFVLLVNINSGIKCIAEPLRILVYSPRMIPSHVAFVADIVDLLAKRGHNVSENVKKSLESREIPLMFWQMSNTPAEQREVMAKLGAVFLEQCKHLVLQTTVLAELETMEFDFAMHEVFDVCGIGIFEQLKIRRSVILSSTGMRDIVSEALGIAGPLEVASILSDYGSTVPVLGVRRNLQFHSAWRNFFQVQSSVLEGIFNFEENFEDLLGYSNLLFVNTHELTDCSRSWARRVFEIGGISFKTPKPLGKEYTEVLSRPEFPQTVLISFGTTTPSFLMPEPYKLAILKAISKFPTVQFIWKYEVEDDFVNSCSVDNVVFKKYVPQADLLESLKISLFITHGGQNSLLEAFRAGTRLLIIPLFGDQHRNAQIALDNGLASVLRKEDLSKWETIETAMRNALQSDKRLNTNLKRVSLNLQNAKNHSETRFLTAIEQVFSISSPPNFKFSKFSLKKFYTSDVILTVFDVAAVFTLVLSSTFLRILS